MLLYVFIKAGLPASLSEFKPLLTCVPSARLCLLLEECAKSMPGTIALANT